MSILAHIKRIGRQNDGLTEVDTFNGVFAQNATLIAITGDVTNWGPEYSQSVLLLDVQGAYSLQGIVPNVHIADGQMLTLINVGSDTLSIPESGSSTADAGNQFAIALTLTPGQAIQIMHYGLLWYALGPVGIA